jgi:5-methylcytosine-specific restriction enzyme subunit McrC
LKFLTVRERDLVPFVGDGGLNAQEDKALAVAVRLLPRGSLTWERGGIRVGPFCGIVRAGDLILEILPKIDMAAAGQAEARGVLVAMLRAANELAVSDVGAAPLNLQKLHLLDVFVLDFCGRMTALLRRGAIRSYQGLEDDLPTLKGRLDLATQVRRAAVDQGLIRCRFDELTADNPHNRILKHVLVKLSPQVIGPEAKTAVSALLLRLDQVSAIRCSPLDIDHLAFSRLNEAWRPLFQRASWFLRGLFPDVRVGDVDGLCLLFDMQRLFEAFIGARLAHAWRGNDLGARVVLQGPAKHLAGSTSGPAFRLRPDAAVISDLGEVDRLLDAKWKRLDPTSPGRGVAREDAYQLTVYATAYRCPRVSLIYPRGDGLPAGLVETFDLQLPEAPRIDVYAVDLLDATKHRSLPAGMRPGE